MELILLTAAAFALIMAAMAVGVIFRNRALRGSCGGPALLDADGVPIACDNCNCRAPEAGGGQPH